MSSRVEIPPEPTIDIEDTRATWKAELHRELGVIGLVFRLRDGEFPPALIEPCVLAGAPVGGVVLDPFFGSGTTGEVAEKHGRKWIGFDINPAYEALQKERTAQRSLILGDATP